MASTRMKVAPLWEMPTTIVCGPMVRDAALLLNSSELMASASTPRDTSQNSAATIAAKSEVPDPRIQILEIVRAPIGFD